MCRFKIAEISDKSLQADCANALNQVEADPIFFVVYANMITLPGAAA